MKSETKFQPGDRVIVQESYPAKEFRGIEGTLRKSKNQFHEWDVYDLSAIPMYWRHDHFCTSTHDLENHFELAEIMHSPLMKALR